MRRNDCPRWTRICNAYITPGDHAPYQSNRELLGFRRFFGPERRDILMLWRNRLEVIFAKHHGREPGGQNAWALVCMLPTLLVMSMSVERSRKRPATTTFDTFHLIPTGENGAIAKVEQSIRNLTSCGPCTSGVTRSSRMRSGCDLPENRGDLPPRANVVAWLTGSRRVFDAECRSFLRQTVN